MFCVYSFGLIYYPPHHFRYSKRYLGQLHHIASTWDPDIAAGPWHHHRLRRRGGLASVRGRDTAGALDDAESL